VYVLWHDHVGVQVERAEPTGVGEDIQIPADGAGASQERAALEGRKGQAVDAPFDVLYVDGDHTIQGVVRDLDLAMKSISKNGVILVDDVSYIPDVKAGVGSWLITNADKVTYKMHNTPRGDMEIRRKE
jgi:predicted O-methyltransferase YrrM